MRRNGKNESVEKPKRANSIAKSLFLAPFWFLLALGFSQGSYARSGIDITGGIGLPELLNAGVRLRLNHTHIGLAVGSFPFRGDRYLCVAGWFGYHFARPGSLQPEWRPWYGKFGVCYLRDETETAVSTYVDIDIRVGLESYLSKAWGITVDGGIRKHVSRRLEMKDSSWLSKGGGSQLMPAAGISLFYRL
jgi:hypothetical protein